MTTSRRIPAEAWGEIALTWSVLVIAASALAGIGAVRVEELDPSIARAGSWMYAALRSLLAIVAGSALGVALHAATGGIEQLARRGRPSIDRSGPVTNPDVRTAQRSISLALVALGGTWAAFRWLILPLVVRGRTDVALPLVAPSAAAWLLPISIGLGSEALLGLARLTFGASREWWAARLLLRLAWIVLLVLVLLGANLFHGDPLEWATGLGTTPLPPEWLAGAPARVGTLWPIAQVVLAGLAVREILLFLAELRRCFGRRAD